MKCAGVGRRQTPHHLPNRPIHPVTCPEYPLTTPMNTDNICLYWCTPVPELEPVIYERLYAGARALIALPGVRSGVYSIGGREVRLYDMGPAPAGYVPPATVQLKRIGPIPYTDPLEIARQEREAAAAKRAAEAGEMKAGREGIVAIADTPDVSTPPTQDALTWDLQRPVDPTPTPKAPKGKKVRSVGGDELF